MRHDFHLFFHICVKFTFSSRHMTPDSPSFMRFAKVRDHAYSECLDFQHKRREPFKRMTLNEIRRRPTLPGRFQPSTISVLRLNFCVRDGNRWIPQAIVTGNFGASHPQNRTGWTSFAPDHGALSVRSFFHSAFLLSLCASFRFRFALALLLPSLTLRFRSHKPFRFRSSVSALRFALAPLFPNP